MSNYTSENTHVLATHMNGNNERMLLLHVCGDGRLQYIVGSYFKVYKEYMSHWPDLDGPAIIADRDGNCFTEDTHESVGLANGRWTEAFDRGGKYHYEWDWGHYFDEYNGNGALLRAVHYWEREVLGIEERGEDGIEG